LVKLSLKNTNGTIIEYIGGYFIFLFRFYIYMLNLFYFMHTLSKQEVSNWVMLDYSSQKQTFQDKIGFFEKKYESDFLAFEKKIELASKENFEAWDDYIEWKAFKELLKEILSKIEDVKDGNFQVA
jgi:hypothetical protein